MSSQPVIIIFGAGMNIGDAVTRKFVGAGYRVATVARSVTSSLSKDGNILTVQADLTQPSQIPGVFATVHDTWKTWPRVIIWNAAKRSFAPVKHNFFSIPTDQLQADFDIANSSPWVAADQAVKNWKEGEKAAFIYTGNLQAKAIVPMPDFTTLGVAKRAATYWLEDADRTFRQNGWRFYYADERNSHGGPAGNPPGADSHADMYLRLAEEESEDWPSYITFVNGEHRKF